MTTKQADLLNHSFGRESGTSNTTNQEVQTDRRLRRIYNKKHPFVLPALGKRPKSCGCPRVWGIGMDGKKLGYVHHKCKRIECPNCGINWIYERTFEMAFVIEAYARVTGERPAHIVAETTNGHLEALRWDIDDYDTFHRRAYRHLDTVAEGYAGYRIFHPYKIHKWAKKELKKLGYGVPMNGEWKGVRENALLLENVEEYYYLLPHDHFISFPSFIEPHSDNRFFLKKIRVLDTLKDVVYTCNYLVSHCGAFKDTEDLDNQPTVPIGKMRGFKPENFLSEDEINELKQEIAEIMHTTENPDAETDENQEDNTEEFLPISVFSIKNSYDESYVDSMISSFPLRYQDFWKEVIRLYNDRLANKELRKEDKIILISELDIPEGIEIIEIFYRKSEKYGEI